MIKQENLISNMKEQSSLLFIFWLRKLSFTKNFQSSQKNQAFPI